MLFLENHMPDPISHVKSMMECEKTLKLRRASCARNRPCTFVLVPAKGNRQNYVIVNILLLRGSHAYRHCIVIVYAQILNVL